MAKPTDLPRWATDPSLVTEPAEGKKDLGWFPGELMPAQFLNWLFRHIYLWIAWVYTYAAGTELANTWSQSQAFNGAFSFNGNDVSNSNWSNSLLVWGASQIAQNVNTNNYLMPFVVDAALQDIGGANAGKADLALPESGHLRNFTLCADQVPPSGQTLTVKLTKKGGATTTIGTMTSADTYPKVFDTNVPVTAGERVQIHMETSATTGLITWPRLTCVYKAFAAS